MKKKYILENLGCAHCASVMEEKINQIDGIEQAVVIYPTKQLHLTAEDPDFYIEEIQKICSSIESKVKVISASPAKTERKEHHHEHHHSHGDSCGCGHDHTEEHHHEYGSSCGCGCGHEHHEEHAHSHEHHNEENNSVFGLRSEKAQLIFGIVLAIAAFVTNYFVKDNNIVLVAYLVAYIFLAKNIILDSFHNLKQGHFLDENFLMTIASLGAFLIGEYPEAVGVILFYRIGEAFEDYAVERSRASIMDTLNMRPESVIQVHGDHSHEIPAEQATPGMILLVRPGDRIPLDGVVYEGTTQLDTSALTGEPVPVSVKEGDRILSGCLNETSVIKIKVENGLEESMVTRIMESMENAAASKPKIDRFITRFARVYTPFVVAAALIIGIIPSLITQDWQYWVYTALTFLVISCPCALVLSVPLAFFSGIGLGSKKGILFKSGSALETLKDVNAVIMDKTGTITKGNFVLQSVITYENITEDQILSYAAACEQNSTHPIAKSIMNAATEQNISVAKADSIEELAGHGIHAVIEGHDILCGNEKLMTNNKVTVSDEHSSYGTEILIAVDGILSGRLLIADTIKSESKESVAQLNTFVKTIMLTGDAEDSAKAIANETGVTEYYAKLLPDDKLNMLQKLREKYQSVMFVGDGINDAPVLAGADCGAAMGSGADAAIEAADVVFMTSELSAIPESIRIAKVTNRIAIENIVFALAVKALIMILGVFGLASMWMAVFADTGVAMLCIINSIRILRK